VSTISTHVLDTVLGRPAAGVPVTLERVDSGSATPLGKGTTDADGRLRNLLSPGRALEPGDYRLHFDTGGYLVRAGHAVFYPAVTVDFRVSDADAHYHVPLLLSPFGYSTYRGS
jgi:5-hydroxyisourate hydrolase